MTFYRWVLSLTLALAVSTLLSACGSKSSDNANLRLLNASVDYQTGLSLQFNTTTVSSGVPYGGVGAYYNVGTSSNVFQLLDPTGLSVYSQVLGVSGTAGPYTLIAYGYQGSVRTAIIDEDQTAPASGQDIVQVMNVAPAAGQVDVYLLSAGQKLASASPLTTASVAAPTGFHTVVDGTYEIVVTGAGNQSDVRMDQPGVTINSASILTLVLTDTTSGVLVNGLMLAQQGNATAITNTLSRLRLVGALPGTPNFAGNVTVTSTGTTTNLVTTTLAPVISRYASITSGAANVATTVNGTAYNQAVTLSPGQDYTLLMYGDLASPQFNLIADNNRLPTVSNTSNMRLYNAVADTTNAISLNVDYVPVVTGVTLGNMAMGTVNNTPLMNSVLNAVGGASYTLPQLTIYTGGVYSTFMMGNAANPVGQLYRDR